MVEITRGFCTLKKFPLAEKKKNYVCYQPGHKVQKTIGILKVTNKVSVTVRYGIEVLKQLVPSSYIDRFPTRTS